MAVDSSEHILTGAENQAPADTGTSRPPVRDRIVELRRVRAGDLVPHPNNYRDHSGAQRATLRAALEEIGHADALIAMRLPDGRLMLINGHMRADIDPDADVPVLILDVSREEADKLLLLMDPLAEMAQRNADRIKALLATVQTQSDALRELFRRTAGERIWQMVHPDDVREADVSQDQVTELRDKYGTELGQLWGAGSNLIKIGDSTDQDVVADLWRAGELRIRTLWTDPAYGVSYADKNQYLNAIDRGNRIQRPIANDHVPGRAPAVFCAALKMALPYAEKAASAYATVPGGPLLPKFIAAFEEAGFGLRSSLVWVKQQFVIGRSDYNLAHELLLYGWRPNGGRHFFTDDRTQSSVFQVDKPHVSALHPTAKPISLIARMLENSTRRGELVYDPFLGSGSTLVAAHQLGRVGYGCELDPGYAAVALERLSLLGLKPELVKP
jgi:DNA modification methylase